jgi:hypothetical protein
MPAKNKGKIKTMQYIMSKEELEQRRKDMHQKALDVVSKVKHGAKKGAKKHH